MWHCMSRTHDLHDPTPPEGPVEDKIASRRQIIGDYLLSLDGTGYFSSKKIHCAQCAEKHHHDGTITYYHQMLGAVLVHPDHKEVFPLAPEPILKQDGAKKNDCERNAAKRLLEDLRRVHPCIRTRQYSVCAPPTRRGSDDRCAWRPR